MDRLIYVAMSGAKQIEMASMINNHNLANINTPGFRADLSNAVSREKVGPGFQTRVYADNGNASVELASGTIVTTGRELDVAVNGDGLIAVLAADGAEAYTRRGDLRINQNGLLETGDGHVVLGNAGPVAIPPAEKIEIASDGTISILPQGQEESAIAVLDRITLVNPDHDKIYKRKDGLLAMKNSEIAVPDASVKLASGSLEKSNVNVIETVVNMIALQRSYEMQINLIHKVTELDTSTAETLRIG